MTKTIALVLASMTLVACAAEDESASSTDPACPSGEAQRKTEGLIDKCAGRYTCAATYHYQLHSDGRDCRMGPSIILRPDGTVSGSPNWEGVRWDGDSVYFTLRYKDGSSQLCELQPEK